MQPTKSNRVAAGVSMLIVLILALLLVPIHISQFGWQFDRFVAWDSVARQESRYLHRDNEIQHVYFWRFQVGNLVYAIRAFDLSR